MNQIWHQDSTGILEEAETYDWFGNSLIAGNFNGDGKDDLAVGVPLEDINSISRAGAVNVLYGSNDGLTATGDQLWHQNSTAIEGTSETDDFFGSSLAAGDFNGDGRDDLAVGVAEDINSIVAAGAVNVLYGSNNGLTATGDQIWHQDIDGIQGEAERGDSFGNSLATGDFNNDGKDDLAVGVPLEDINSISNGGAVNIIYGSNDGLTATGNQIWHQDSTGIEFGAEADDHFGSSLAAGDFNGDGKDDLAVGVPLEDISSIADAGAVNVIYGSNEGLTATDDQIWHQDVDGIKFGAEAGDRFGSTLAVGDFNNDGKDDLAVGVPDEDIGSIVDAGVVNVIYGSNEGLTATDDQIWHQDVDGIEFGAETGDRFGSSLAVGDFNGDGFDDLAVGVVDEDIGSIVDAGAVNVIYGSANGLTAAGDQIWHQDRTGILGVAEEYDHFGTSLTAGDFNNDGFSDLAVGVPGDNFNAGAANILYGSTTGLIA